jgi:hypothetical protein
MLVKVPASRNARQRASRAFSCSFPLFPGDRRTPSGEAKRSEMKREAKRIEAK